MAQTIITHHWNIFIWKNTKYKLEINKLNNSNNDIHWG